uniref:centromere-associated protein E-like isoform X2 n=1 Tax=Jaculus jaculus TaxID=51337 RepID=UPI001E1B0EAD|nr:centromere-associated protein E-like isoform X2 [Jaculus jaculus]
MAEEVAVAVAVCVRVRPVCNREGLEEATHVYWKTDNNAIYQIDGSKSFSFDRVFHSNETTKNVYDEIAVPIIDSAIQGYNGTVFAYGQTASGKTHTMMGSENCLGVIPRAIHDIFQKIKKLPEREFLLRVSYMEIYNETITDLLCNTQKVKPLIIREDINRNVYVADLTEEVVYTSEMALQWLSKGEKNRHYGITKMNQRSSRSHTIFRMILESREKGESSSCDGSIKVSHLNLVDLAGSERASQTGAEGVRLKEGCNINRSLFILGQVIKKLSDGQVGGFINYRDSKLTRILQNSLGGNAKTRIICTITPISFDETLSTLQFASTAKYMKNTPFVNEVSSDEALLKRYRKEIVDLKKQLEEVSVKTRVQEMEKDQLAQLLDEKDLLQKVQDEKIQNLKRMLVTSSSIALQQELKAKKKRRVTWCLGKVNKMSDSTDVNEFEVPTNVTTRTHKSSITVLGEIDESVCVETDTFSNTLEPLTETEWSSATTLLSQVELIHEISNLKDLVKHAKAYNQDLENELSSKVELLKDKEDQIKNLQKHINIQNSDTIKMDLSYSLETTEDLKQMKQDLVDTEAVVLYAKKKSTFLTSENLELKEKIKKLLNSCKQMEDDIQLYQRQLETEKKTQADLDKELQSSFNEIRKLNSLLDGKVPKDLLCNLELERKIDDLQSELNKEFNENETLRKEVKLLSELKPLPSEVQMLRTEIHKKSKELTIITSEKEKLISEVVHKDNKIQSLLEEMGKTKGDLAASQLDCRNIDEEFQNFKTLHMEFEQKYKNILEENEKMKQELSGKTQELQQETAKSQDRLDEVEQLKEELENKDSALRSVEKENSLLTETLQQTLEEVKTLTQEKDDLQQLQESLQIERDQLRNDIQDTINTNIDTQEQLRTALESLKKHKEIINTLKRNISENSSETLHTVDAMGQLQQEDLEKEDELRIAHVHLKEQQDTIDKLRRAVTDKTDELAAVQRDLEHANAAAKAQIQELKEKEDQLIKANNDVVGFMDQIEQLKKRLETQNTVLESAEMEKLRLTKELHENLEEIRFLTDENDSLKLEEETLRAERDQLRESLTKAEANIPVLHKEQVLLPNVKEVSECPETVNKLEPLEEQSKPMDSTSLENLAMEKLRLTEKLQGGKKEIKYLTKQSDDWQILEAFQLEHTQLKEDRKEILAKIQEAQGRECSFTVGEKDGDTTKISKKGPLKRRFKARYSAPPRIDVEKLPGSLEGHGKVGVLHQLQRSLPSQQDRFTGHMREVTTKHLEAEEELKIAHCCLKEQHEKINRLTAILSEKEYEISSFQMQLESAKHELQRKDLEKEDELRIAHVHLKEQQDTVDKLKRAVTDKTDELAAVQRDLGHANAAAKAQIQELKEKEDQLTKAKDDLVEFMYQMEQLKKQLKTQNSVLECADIEKFRLNKKLHENLEEIRFLTEENNNLKCEEETLRAERDQLRESLTKAEANIQELKENELQLLKLEGKHSEAQKQLKEQGMTLSKIEMENLTLAQKLHENFEEIKTLVTERDNLRKAEEILKLERDQFKENLEKITAKDLDTQQELKIAHMHLKEQEENIDNLRQKLGEKTTQISDIQKDLDKSKDELPTKNHKGDVKHKRKLLCDAEQHPTENLKEKCLKIKELLKKYSEMDNDYECLDRLSLDLEKEIETQKELSVRVKGNLYLPYSQTKQIQKLLAENQRCSVESFRVMKKLKYVLSHVTRIKEEQHDTINKFELAFVEEVEKQNELQTKIQCLDMDYNAPASRELKDLKLNPNIDEHIEEILKDFSEYDFQSIRTEFQQLLNDQKEMCQLLEEWLSAPFDIEKLKLAIQKENSSLFRVNNFYNDKITAIINESTEFEERSAIRSKDWKCDLNVMKEKTKKLVEDYQSLTASQSSARICSTTPSRKTQHVASGRIQMTAEKIQELETSLHEAKESAVRKEDKIVKLQEELKVTNDIIAKLENKVNESNKCLEKAKETIQLLQEEVAVGAKVYKEEIEDLKTKLVKTDLEKMKNGREHEKEMNSTKATIEYQKEMIRALRENLRRNQQAQDTSLTSEYDLQPPVKPLTCGGGSGIIQSTKALILKSEYVRLEKEMSKLKQQNEEITKQKNELLSENHHLSSVIKTWKERIFKSEAYKKGTCENSPESPKVTRTGTKKKLNTPSQYKEGNLRDIVLNESPKSSFFDSRSKSLPACYPVRYFDNSSLGLFPEEQTIETNSLDAKPDLWPSSSRKETDDCKMQ